MSSTLASATASLWVVTGKGLLSQGDQNLLPDTVKHNTSKLMKKLPSVASLSTGIIKALRATSQSNQCATRSMSTGDFRVFALIEFICIVCDSRGYPLPS